VKTLFLATFLTVALAASLTAQSDALRAAAERYVQHPVQQKMIDDALSPDTVVAQLRATAPQLTDEQVQVAATIVVEEMVKIRPALEVAVIEAVASTFTLDEIEALETFYNSPPGASAMSKIQPFMVSAMGSMAGPLQAAQSRIGQRMAEELMAR